jgi:hypothetical protein
VQQALLGDGGGGGRKHFGGERTENVGCTKNKIPMNACMNV